MPSEHSHTPVRNQVKSSPLGGTNWMIAHQSDLSITPKELGASTLADTKAKFSDCSSSFRWENFACDGAFSILRTAWSMAYGPLLFVARTR